MYRPRDSTNREGNKALLPDSNHPKILFILIKFVHVIHPIANDLQTVLGNDAFWVELNTLYVTVDFVPARHHGSVFSPRGDL